MGGGALCKGSKTQDGGEPHASARQCWVRVEDRVQHVGWVRQQLAVCTFILASQLALTRPAVQAGPPHGIFSREPPDVVPWVEIATKLGFHRPRKLGDRPRKLGRNA